MAIYEKSCIILQSLMIGLLSLQHALKMAALGAKNCVFKLMMSLVLDIKMSLLSGTLSHYPEHKIGYKYS